AFVAKLNAAGSGLIYSTYLGGSATDVGYGIALDPTGDAYVVGSTNSTNFPTTPGAYQSSLPGGSPNNSGFVSKLSDTGDALVYSTYLGSVSTATGVAVDASGHAFVTGFTGPGFPTTMGAFQTSMVTQNTAAFVTELNTGGTGLVYS